MAVLQQEYHSAAGQAFGNWAEARVAYIRMANAMQQAGYTPQAAQTSVEFGEMWNFWVDEAPSSSSSSSSHLPSSSVSASQAEIYEGPTEVFWRWRPDGPLGRGGGGPQ